MPWFRKYSNPSANGYALFWVILTTLIIALILLLFDPTKIAKLASTFQLLMFALICIGVIVMRESRIEAYDPGFRSPFYPWLQIIGVFFSFFADLLKWV